MKLKDIPSHLNISAAQLAALMNVSRQALNNYTSGRKGKASKFLIELLAVANLNQVEIIFPDVFDHPSGENSEHPAYWANVAIEALREAEKRGLQVNEIAQSIVTAVSPTLSHITPSI